MLFPLRWFNVTARACLPRVARIPAVGSEILHVYDDTGTCLGSSHVFMYIFCSIRVLSAGITPMKGNSHRTQCNTSVWYCKASLATSIVTLCRAILTFLLVTLRISSILCGYRRFIDAAFAMSVLFVYSIKLSPLYCCMMFIIGSGLINFWEAITFMWSYSSLKV